MPLKRSLPTPLIDAYALEQALFLELRRYCYSGLRCAEPIPELAIIRWQSTVLEFFAFYKNYSLLECVVGLGLGYALPTRGRIPLLLVIPLLASQFVLMIVVRFGPGDAEYLRALPISEQPGMGIGIGSLRQIFSLYSWMIVSFVMTVLSFLPIGQLCRRLMERREKLHAYGLNLLGSLFGVLLMLLASFLWAPPVVWFALASLAILVFQSVYILAMGCYILAFVSDLVFMEKESQQALPLEAET